MRHSAFWSSSPASAPCFAAAPDVPNWFKPDPKNPYAIFDAWRRLSTTEAALYLDEGWYVFAGVLRDEAGKPIANCPLEIAYEYATWDSGEPLFADLRTDKDGLFIIYSPPPPVPPQNKTGEVPPDEDDRGPVFYAAPGCPFSPLALRFGHENQKFKECRAQAITVSDERQFFILTCPRQSTFNEGEFRTFVEKQRAAWKPRPACRAPAPQAWHGSYANNVRDLYGKVEKYKVRLVSQKGNAIPGAAVQYTACDRMWIDNAQTVFTDKNGECTLLEQLLAREKKAYYDAIDRYLSVSAAGCAAGPVSPNLKKGAVNVITVEEGATIHGRLVDWNGNPNCSGGVYLRFVGGWVRLPGPTPSPRRTARSRLMESCPGSRSR